MQIKQYLGKGALAGLVLAGSISGAVVASGPAAASTQPSAPASATPQSGSVLTGAVVAMERLVADGTLTRAQGDAIEQQIRAGSIDPKQLVQDGVVSDAQMRIAAAAIAQVKFASG